MNEVIFVIIGLITGVVIGFLVAILFNRKAAALQEKLSSSELELTRKTEIANQALDQIEKQTIQLNELNKTQNELQKDLATYKEKFSNTYESLSGSNEIISALEHKLFLKQEENANLQKSNVQKMAENNMLKEKLQTFREELTKEFELLSSKILDEKSRKFSELNQEQVKQILHPFEKEIKEFKEKVNETYLSETRERHSLQGEIKRLIDLNQQLSADAKNLTRALTADTKTQGDWGEMILETILQRSGLEKGREFTVQDHMQDEEGNRLRPDVVVRLPDDRNIIIDSKVSLTAYDRFINAEEDEEQKKQLIQHMRSVKNHIDELKRKNYTDYPGSPEYIFMFIPIEPAYFSAMQADPELWNYGYDKGIILIGPTNLIAALKLVSEIWSREKQSRNAMEIAERAGNLYDKFVGFTESLTDVGKNLDKANDSYQKVLGQLKDGKGNLVNRADQLRKLGAKNKKNLDRKLLELNEEDDEDYNDEQLD